MFFLAPFHLVQLISPSPVDGSWFFGAVGAMFMFLVWNTYRSMKEDNQEIKNDIKEIKTTLHEQDKEIAIIKRRLP